MAYIHDFSFFKENVYHRSELYQRAVDEVLAEAAKRAGLCILVVFKKNSLLFTQC